MKVPADPALVARDLAGQAEHGITSPVWLVTDDTARARAVIASLPGTIARLGPENGAAARAAGQAMGEGILCDTREEMAREADRIAPEPLQGQCRDTGRRADRLTGDGARYNGGLSVHKVPKTVTWQRVSRAALPELARATAVFSRAEGMIGHALTAEARLDTFAPWPRAATS